MLTAYIEAGYIPVVGCIFSSAMDYVKNYYQEFTENITCRDGRFFAEGEGTKYYWENDMLFVKEQ